MGGDKRFLRAWVDELKKRRDEAAAILSATPILRCSVPDGAFYLYVNCSGAINKRAPDGYLIDSDSAMARYLVDKAGVGTVYGAAFGSSPYLRVAYAVPRPTLKDACERIADACNLLV